MTIILQRPAGLDGDWTWGQRREIMVELTGAQPYEGNYRVVAAPYAKGKIVVQTTGWQGLKSRACCLAGAVGGKYVGRSGGYTMSVRQAERFLDLYEGGYDACVMTNKIEAPKLCE